MVAAAAGDAEPILLLLLLVALFALPFLSW
jgi:hypothetical protein